MIKKIIKIVLLLLCMILIFSFSSDNGSNSSKKSDGLIIRIYQSITHNKLSDKEKEIIVDKYVIPVRKSAHIIVYLILGVLSISLIKEYRLIDIKALIISIIFCFLYACSDEIHQLFVMDRSGEVLDVLIDSIGSFIGIYLYYLVYKKKGVKRHEQEKATS